MRKKQALTVFEKYNIMEKLLNSTNNEVYQDNNFFQINEDGEIEVICLDSKYFGKSYIIKN